MNNVKYCFTSKTRLYFGSPRIPNSFEGMLVSMGPFRFITLCYN
jgi:hypothetical protein